MFGYDCIVIYSLFLLCRLAFEDFFDRHFDSRLDQYNLLECAHLISDVRALIAAGSNANQKPCPVWFSSFFLYLVVLFLTQSFRSVSLYRLSVRFCEGVMGILPRSRFSAHSLKNVTSVSRLDAIFVCLCALLHRSKLLR